MGGGAVQSSQHLTGCHKRSDEISFQLLQDFSHQQWDSLNHYTWISMLPWEKSIVSWYDECSIFTGLHTCGARLLYINRTSTPLLSPVVLRIFGWQAQWQSQWQPTIGTSDVSKGPTCVGCGDTLWNWLLYYDSTLQIRYDVMKIPRKNPQDLRKQTSRSQLRFVWVWFLFHEIINDFFKDCCLIIYSSKHQVPSQNLE